MKRCRVALGLHVCLIGLLAGLSAVFAADDEEGLADTTFPHESAPTERRLEAADKLAAAGKWREALDDYRRIMADAGSVLVPVDSKSRARCVQVRRLIQVRLASPKVPNETLRQYRKRVDDQARTWLKAGTDNRDATVLRRIVDEAFRSSATEQALELLGDLAFERGDFGEARYWWRILAAPVAEAALTGKNHKLPPEELLLPDVEPNRLARVQAKQIIARLFQGERLKITDDLRAFEKLHPEAAGGLAGTQGKYAVILRALVARTIACPPLEDDDIWTTFAGSPSRNLTIPAPLSPRIASEGYKWSARLDAGTVEVSDDGGFGGQPADDAFVGRAESLAFHPVIAGSVVLWADARFVNAHDIVTGKRTFRYDLLADPRNGPGVLQGVDLRLPAPAGLRYSVSVTSDRVFVRCGTQGLAPRKELKADPRNSFIVCLDLKPSSEKRALWQVPANVLDTDDLAFEGAPLVHEGRVYAVLSRVGPTQTKSSIACFDAESGKEQWRQAVCETKTPQSEAGDVARLRHHLLTRAGPSIVFCSHSGAIAAVDALTGQPTWAFRYLSRGPRTTDGGASPRDLAPCVAAAGLLFAAPADSDRVLCLSADTGRLVWDLDRVEVVHLLGVSEGRLVFTTPTEVRAVEAATGEEEKGRGWSQPAEGKLPGFGRGFLAGGWGFFPVAPPLKAPLRALNVQNGTYDKGEDVYDPNQFYRLARGNLTFGNGCLTVAGTERLYVYVPERRYLSIRKAEAARPHPSSRNWYLLAIAEADAGLHEQSALDFARAEMAPPRDKFRGELLRDLARAGRQRALLELARSKEAGMSWGEAASLLSRAAGTDFTSAQRVEAYCRLADMWTRAGEPAKAVATWQAILADSALRYVPVASRDVPWSAWSYARARVEAILRMHGREVFAAFEKEAAALFASADGRDAVPFLERLMWEYPNASVTGPALLRLATAYDNAGKPARAARAYRMLLQRGRAPPVSADDLARARYGLATIYERQGRWASARRAWQDLGFQSGDQIVATPQGGRKASALAVAELLKPAFRATPTHPVMGLRMPFTRVWEQPPPSWEKTEPTGRLLVPDVSPRGARARDFALFLRGGTANKLECRDVDTGKRRWQTAIRDAPTWMAQVGNMDILACPRGILCLGLGEGNRLWELQSPPLPIGDSRNLHAHLSAFHVTCSHLYCLQDECRLLAIDIDTGEVAWSRRAPAAIRPLYPAGRFMPQFHAGDERLVVQAGSGKQLVLDSCTGDLLHETGNQDLWPRPPLPLGERRLCLVADPARIVMLDPATGKTLWTHDASTGVSTVASGEAPRLFGQGKILVALLGRNYGYQLERLNPGTGNPLWKKETRLVREAPANVDFDSDRLYYVCRRSLCARSLKTGKLLWSRRVTGPPGEWRVVSCKGHVLAYPARVHVEPRWHFVPAGGSAIALPLRVRRGAGLTMMICRAADGTAVQPLHFPGLNPQAAVQLFPHRLAIEVDGHAWGLADATLSVRSK